MTTSLFIKSHERDFPWLEWCRKSIERFCSGFHEIVLCLPEGVNYDWPGAKIVHVRETFNPYLFQQAVKLFADTFCSGDYIVYQDSDTCFDRPVKPEDFMIDGKPYWIIRPYGQARTDQQVWRQPTADFLGQDFEFEAMARHPFMLHRDVLKRIRGFCQFKHGIPLNEYIASKAVPNVLTALVFSEFNALGAFAFNHCKDQLHWIDSSVTEPPPGVCWQGHTWDTPEKNALNVAKMKEVFEQSISQQGAGDGVTRPPLTLQDALAFLASQGANEKVIEDLRRSVAPKKRGGRKKGSKNKPKVKPSNSWLLAIHSYPGANETFARHWDNFKLSGADRIVGIGTLGGGCEFPCEYTCIGENAYMKLKGKDDHLCRRLLDTVKWCMTQRKHDRFTIAEYDCLFLKKFPKFHGVSAFKTGGPVNGSKTSQFFHPPWSWDRESGPKLIAAMEAVLEESAEYPNNSPDLFFGYACEKAGIEVSCNYKMFTRNSWDAPGDLDLAIEAAKDGAHVLHGCKFDHEFNSVMAALNGKHLELSHAQ